MNKSEEIILKDDDLISDVMKLRFYPAVVETGHGAILINPDGKEYLDFNAGWGVANTGYNHPRIINAVNKQMQKLSFASTISVLNNECIELAEQLCAMTPGDFEKSVWYGHSGSDANEFIAKIAPVSTGKSRILSFVGSYHGQTMGSYAMSGHPAQSRFIGGGNVHKLPYPYCYRCAFEKNFETCGLFCLKYIEDYFFPNVCSPDKIAAVIIEAIQCDGGDVVPPEGFLKSLEQLCRKNDILLILDEVKIGFGRTGKMFGFENWDIVPDAVIMGKPMGSGQPLSAVVGRKELTNAGTGMHFFTTAGNPVACAASMETIKILHEEKLLDNSKITGLYFTNKLHELQNKYQIIGDVRGKGLVIGIELVENRKTKEPAEEKAALIVYRCYELGLLFYYAGIHSNVLEFTPPLVITKEQVDRAVAILEQAIIDVEGGRISINDIADYTGWNS